MKLDATRAPMLLRFYGAMLVESKTFSRMGSTPAHSTNRLPGEMVSRLCDNPSENASFRKLMVLCPELVLFDYICRHKVRVLIGLPKRSQNQIKPRRNLVVVHTALEKKPEPRTMRFAPLAKAAVQLPEQRYC